MASCGFEAKEVPSGQPASAGCMARAAEQEAPVPDGSLRVSSRGALPAVRATSWAPSAPGKVASSSGVRYALQGRRSGSGYKARRGSSYSDTTWRVGKPCLPLKLPPHKQV